MQVPGTVTLIGSGETSATGGQVYEIVARQILEHALPQANRLQISVLETPAGFEANAQRVAGRVAEFIQTRLQNDHPEVHLIAARKKGSRFSPDSPEIVEPLLNSQMIFFGPGSPTYTIRQLENSLAWQTIVARHRMGAALLLASAATIAISTLALPVYEIYKVGEDPHWKHGLDLFEPYGLRLAIIPHWNNHEGGEDVDTSRCFMGQERMDALCAMLPNDTTILGIDEHTALTIDFETETCYVRGLGEVHLLRGSEQQQCSAGCSFPIFDLGDFRPLPSLNAGLPENIWRQVLAAQDRKTDKEDAIKVPGDIQELVAKRQEARQAKDWALADQIRDQIARLGWRVKDTPGGPDIQPDH